MLLIDNDEPKFAPSKTDKDEPRRLRPKSEKDEPTLT